jgi:hypothetical protein
MYIHPSGWRYYHNPTLKLVTNFSMDVGFGQEKFRHAQQLSGGEAENIPDGWEKLIDAGEKLPY